MTEAEWLLATDPKPMLQSFPGQASSRKTRLFACETCRRILHIANDPRVESYLEMAESVAEEHRTVLEEAYVIAQSGAFDALNETEIGSPARIAIQSVINAAFHVWIPSCAVLAAETSRDARLAKDRVRRRVEVRNQVFILRDIFGNPFRPVTFDPEWRTSTVVSLAQSMYDSRDFSTIPILSDALEDAGCENLIPLSLTPTPVEPREWVCCLCYETISPLQPGNNPWPLAEDGWCCNNCNNLVIAARLRGLEPNNHEPAVLVDWKEGF